MKKMNTFFGVIGMMTLAFVAPVHADNFFDQKTITITVGLGAGGSYDLYSRLLARYMGAYIPGKPSFIVQNRPGAGGMLAFNQAARGPKDGTLITAVSQGLLLQEVIGAPGLDASLGSFKWIGNFTQENNVTVTWHTSSIKTISDAKLREVPLAASGAGSTSAQIAELYNNLLGTKFRAIMGYESGAQQTLAMERGEMEGRATNTWSSYKASFPDARSRLNVLVQIGLRREQELSDIPLLTELVKDDKEKVMVAQLVSECLAVARPFAAPPGTPEDRVEILRHAFDLASRDPQLIGEASRLRLDLSPMNGSDVEKVINGAIGSAPETKKTVAILFK
jgi:tripartite-type tricarboxylate transporter receptor subunit TctC